MELSEIRKRFKEWEGLTLNEKIRKRLPPTMSGFAQYYHVALPTVKGWRYTGRAKRAKEDSELDTCPVCEGRGKIDLSELDPEKIQLFLRKALMSQAAHKPQAAKALMELEGLFTQKVDIKEEVKFDASDYEEIRAKVWARLSEIIPERCGGVCPLLQKPLLLPEKLREDTGREQGDNSLGAVAPSGISS